MTPRQQRALEIVSGGALDTLAAAGPEHWLVPASLEGAFYVTSTSDCTCPDLRFNNVRSCKHQIAIRLQRVLDACKESSS